MSEVPIGIKLIQVLYKFCKCRKLSDTWYKSIIFLLTFVSYTCYHASRRPLSIVKSYFNRSCDNLTPPTNIIIDDSNRYTWCDWAPFYGPHASTFLGSVDSAFLFAYAIAMFLSGLVAERVSLRYFLSLGMMLSGLSCYLLGITKTYNIHSMWYFVIIQIFGGIVQTSGWPGVVTVMGHWFGKNKRGLIFGLWNLHTSVGNMIGGLIAGYFLEIDWGLSFIIPGLVITLAGFLIFLFLIESPADISFEGANLSQFNTVQILEDNETEENPDDSAEHSDTELLSNQPVNSAKTLKHRSRDLEEKAIGCWEALHIPGVGEFSSCLFFVKFNSYSLLYWLPLYIYDSTPLSGEFSAFMSTLFDFGGAIGGVAAGAFSDYSGKNAYTCTLMLLCSLSLFPLYFTYGQNIELGIVLLLILGFFVNGPYALITTAVSAELGTHQSLTSNSKALATVTAIIDGTGSLGAALGPLLVGFLQNIGWNAVFYMMVFSNGMALLMLVKLVKRELCRQNSEAH